MVSLILFMLHSPALELSLILYIEERKERRKAGKERGRRKEGRSEPSTLLKTLRNNLVCITYYPHIKRDIWIRFKSLRPEIQCSPRPKPNSTSSSLLS